MPARSTAQRRAAAIARQHPGQLQARNRGLLELSVGELATLAHTAERGLPHRTARRRKTR